MGLGLVPRPDYSEARDKAPSIAAALDAAMTALPRRPTPEEVEAAKAEADNLRWPGQKAQTARLKLPYAFLRIKSNVCTPRAGRRNGRGKGLGVPPATGGAM